MISAENVSVAFDGKIVVEAVSLELHCCRITAIVGPSGCGKSSFLSALNRLTDLMPGSSIGGRIHVDGVDILSGKEPPVGLRQRVGMIFQRPNPFPLSIERNIQLALREHGERNRAKLAEATEKSLRRVGLWDEVKDRLGESAMRLSGGQQQRLCIARALALEPQALLFDEPTSALDPLSARVIEDLIQELGHQLAIAIVTHDLSQAKRLADDLTVICYRDGRGVMVACGPATDVFRDPGDSDAALYLGER
jgi:phosphate transport system ATP-binding protein